MCLLYLTISKLILKSQNLTHIEYLLHLQKKVRNDLITILGDKSKILNQANIFGPTSYRLILITFFFSLFHFNDWSFFSIFVIRANDKKIYIGDFNISSNDILYKCQIFLR